MTDTVYQLPPLTDAMYHAVRGSEYEFTSGGPETVKGYLNDECLDEIWENINTALRCQPNAPTVSDKAVAENLAMMLRRMIWQINKMDGDSSLKVLAGNATDLIKRYGLQGSPLRSGA